MEKDIIKKGFAEAEKQQQEEKVKKIKDVVLKHLEKIDYHQKLSQDHAEKAKLLKKDLDDLKAGRIDRIEERHEKDVQAKEIRIIEVHKIIDRYIPLQPWISPYHIEWAPTLYQPVGSISGVSSLSLTATSSSIFTNIQAVTTSNLGDFTGANFANFSGGSYQLNDKTINL